MARRVNSEMLLVGSRPCCPQLAQLRIPISGCPELATTPMVPSRRRRVGAQHASGMKLLTIPNGSVFDRSRQPLGAVGESAGDSAVRPAAGQFGEGRPVVLRQVGIGECLFEQLLDGGKGGQDDAGVGRDSLG
jgi:hypothetical protein